MDSASVVERRTNSFDRRLNAGGRKAFAEGQRRVLRPVVVMMDQPGQGGMTLTSSGQIACSTASKTSWVVIVVPVRQPRIRQA